MIYLNGKPINVTLFPDQTSQVWKLDSFEPNSIYQSIEWEFQTEGEFMELAQLKTLLDQQDYKAFLTLKYLPYGRQDKDVGNTQTFALRTFATLLNKLHFDKVVIMDPHSQVALDLINNSEAVYPILPLLNVESTTKVDIICYPDKGAYTKYSHIYDFPFTIRGEKVRDQLTGTITSYTVSGDVTNKKVLIVDDICDGGATFVKLAEMLKEKGAKEVYLFVTHGIFSKGLQHMYKAGIEKIFTQYGEALEYYNQPVAYRRLDEIVNK